MTGNTIRSPGVWKSRYGLSLALSLATFAFALFAFQASAPTPARLITLTAGPEGTTRAVVAHALADEISARGVATKIVATGGTLATFDLVDSGAVDFALVSGALRTERYTHVREVAPLYVETLHLLVKREFAEAVGRGLVALRGRTVNLGPMGSASHGLATSVLALAGIPEAHAAGVEGYIARHTDPAEIDAVLASGRRSDLPDAVFHLATAPSKIALKYIRAADYRLVAISFADAYRLSAIIMEGAQQVSDEEVERLYTQDAVIPAFTYEIEPPVPAEPTHTLGVPLLMVANDAVSPETVGRVLEAVFDSRFARMHQPPLERSLLTLPARIPLHSGTLAFRQRDQSLFTADDVDALSNSLSVIGALIGSGLFLWQAWRQRRQSRRDEVFGSYLVRVAAFERKLAELELSSSLELETLISLQRDLLQLKSEALEHFATGALGSQTALVDLLSPINTARDHIGQLLLHVRETLEAKAEVEGRLPEELWEEASEATEEGPAAS